MSRGVTTGRRGGPRQISADRDSDVRAPAAQAHRGPPGTRPRRLAHSLLSSTIVHVVLLASVASMSACVVPVAPNFQDPVGEPNVPPYIVSATPFSIGSFVSNPTQDFQVTVTDQNVGDTLAYQWVIDYPPYNSSTHPLTFAHIQPSADRSQQRVTVGLGKSPCGFNPVQTLAVHQLEFILADREFDQSNSMVLDALPPESDGFVVRANWTFSCP